MICVRWQLEDEHNYANYYQFKKQGGHHGVVVTSEHREHPLPPDSASCDPAPTVRLICNVMRAVSPGRWYIGVCNYVPDPPSFDDKKRGKGSGSANTAIDYAEYTVSLFPFVSRDMLQVRDGPSSTQQVHTVEPLTMHVTPLAEIDSEACCAFKFPSFMVVCVDGLYTQNAWSL